MVSLNNKTLTIVKWCLLFYYCINTSFSIAQNNPYNLVPNYSFEQYTVCPTGHTSDVPNFWYKPDRRAARYFNACANNANPVFGVPTNSSGLDGFQNAKTGQAYMALFYYNGNNSRNYIQVKLLDSFKINKCYYAEYYVNLMNFYMLGCNNQSMLFTNNPIYVDTANNLQILPTNPQIQNSFIVTDTLHWVKIAGVFTAQGGEQYLTLGNFKNNAQTATRQIQPTGYLGAAYYLEDVTVVPLDSFTLQADAGLDKSIIVGDSVFVGSFTTGLNNVTWFNSNGNIIASNVSGLFVKPTASTFYVIEQTVCGQYSRDTVNVIVNTAVPLVIKNYELIIKNDAVVNNWQTLQEVTVSHFNIQYSNNSIDFSTVKTVAAKNKNYNTYSTHTNPPSGVRGYYRIEAVDKDGKLTYSKVLPFTQHPTPFALSIYPNPAKNKIVVQSTKMQHIILTDITGRVIKTIPANSANSIEINVAHLPRGMYIVQIQYINGRRELEKFLVD